MNVFLLWFSPAYSPCNELVDIYLSEQEAEAIKKQCLVPANYYVEPYAIQSTSTSSESSCSECSRNGKEE